MGEKQQALITALILYPYDSFVSLIKPSSGR